MNDKENPEKRGDRPAHRLPGDLTDEERIERMLRVDHAGEYGAVRIYAGQLAVLGRRRSAEAIKEMADQEREHLAKFNELVPDYQARPTALLPFWHVAGYALGVGTALLGERAAMACTVAVEDVINEHYAKQVAELEGKNKELAGTFEEFRQDELDHRDTALSHGAEQAPGYRLLSEAIKGGSRLAIWLSERF